MVSAIPPLTRRGFTNLRVAIGTTDTVDWRGVAVLAVFLVVGVGIYAIVEINSGAAFRRRIQFVPVVLVLAVVGLQHVRTTASRRRLLPFSQT